MLNLDRSASSRSSEDTERSKINITIPSDIKHLREVSSRILEGLAHYRLSEEALFEIRLCIEEAVRNAIVHGNRSDKNLPVNISYSTQDRQLVMEVEDSGAGFNPQSVPDPTADDNILKGGGRGVYLIKHLMDKVEYNDTGNKIRMVKRI